MKSLFKKFYLAILLLLVAQIGHSQPMHGKGIAPLVKKQLAALVLSSSVVWGGVLPSAVAQEAAQAVQEEVQAEASPWTLVGEETPELDYLYNVFNLHVTRRDEPETQFLFPAGYLGKSVHGEDIFIAYERPAGTSLLEEVADGVDMALIDYSGQMWEGISIRAETVAKDALDGFLDLVIFAVVGADLELAQEPLTIGAYPYDDGGAMVRLASYQRRSYRPKMLEEEIAEVGAAGFNLGTRNDCRVIVNPNWKSMGVGLHTCRGPGSEGFTGGAMIFYQRKLAAIQNAAVNTFAVVRAVSPDVVKRAAAMLAGNKGLSVEARGKLTTTWGALKTMQ